MPQASNNLQEHLHKLKTYFNRGLDLITNLDRKDSNNFDLTWQRFETIMNELSGLIEEAKIFAQTTDPELLKELHDQCKKNLSLNSTLQYKLQEELFFYRQQLEKIPIAPQNSYGTNHDDSTMVGVKA